MNDVEELSGAVRRKFEPLLGLSKNRGGYDCCGCSTLDDLLDDIVAYLKDHEE